MSGVVAFEGELNSIVREYLEFGEFERSLHTFEKECIEKGKPSVQSSSRKLPNSQQMLIQENLIQLFTLGNRSEFFHLWNGNIEEKVRNHDPVAQKLEFYLNIYFAVYPIKYGTPDAENNMNEFKTYLETRGAALSQTTEFLPFYALPFVPNPKAHPSYKELFSDRWVPDLKIRLEKFLTLCLKSVPQPRLFELYKGGSKDAQTLQQQLFDSERKATTYMKRYNRMQADYHNLIGITADLVDSLERTVQGDPVTPEYLQHVCMRLFSNQVRQTVDFTRPGTAAEVLRQSVLPPQGLQHSETQPAMSLDFPKIKHDLVSLPERELSLLLQALRWKLTKSAPPERDTILQDYISHDILGCRQTGPHQRAVLRLFQSDSEVVRQYMARLLNAFASLSDGRSYLASNSSLMQALTENLRSETRDSLTRENVLGCLQKLSLKRNLQSEMIEDGMLLWLVSVLEDNDSLSDYTLEYSVALLMNLCLRSAGKRKCAEHANQVLQVLSDLLGHDNQEIIPYVNGALYSILSIPSIREEAKAMGMEEILQCFIKDGQTEMNRQIQFIIKQLNSTEDPDEAESDDEDDDEDEEDQDAMEADLDKEELLAAKQGELSGDRLLYSLYSGNTSPQHRKKRVTDGVLQEEVLTRPVTPGYRRTTDNSIIHVQPRTSEEESSEPDRLVLEDIELPPTGPGSRPGSRPGTGSRPPTGSRPSSRSKVDRPPTRSGSRPSSAQEDEDRVPPPVPVDSYDSNLINKITGTDKKLAKASEGRGLKPSTKAMEKMNGNMNTDEYSAAFSTRSRIPRTPDVSSTRPTSRGSLGDGPPPTPKYSDTLPTSRPNSGGKPSSGGKKTPSSPGAGGQKRSKAR